MNFPWNCTPVPDQPGANQDVLDNDLHRAFVDAPGSLLGAKDMLEDSRSYLNTADYQTSGPNHHTQPSVGPWMSDNLLSSIDHNRRNFTQDQYSTQPVCTSIAQTMAIPPQQIIYFDSTATDMLPSVPNYSFWNNTPTPHSTQYHDLALGGACIGYSSSSAMASGYLSPSTSQNVYPNGRSSQFDISHTVASHTPFVFDPTMPTSDFSPYNILPHQRQTRAVSLPGPLSLLVTPPPLAAESPRFTSVMQPHASHGEQIGYPPNQPPVHQPNSFPLHSHPLPSPLSCRWLNDGAVTHCGFTGTLDALKSHCKAVHFIGPKIAQIKCQWEGCDYYKRNNPTVHVMRRDCMWRHTCEVHLRLKRGSI